MVDDTALSPLAAAVSPDVRVLVAIAAPAGAVAQRAVGAGGALDGVAVGATRTVGREVAGIPGPRSDERPARPRVREAEEASEGDEEMLEGHTREPWSAARASQMTRADTFREAPWKRRTQHD
jgi:hypothetical protein